MSALLYVLSSAVSFVCSIIAVYCYSRLLPAAEYGRYILLFSGIMLTQQCVFLWLSMGAKRFGTRGLQARSEIASAIYGGYAACAAITIVTYLAIRPFLPVGGWPISASDIGLAILLLQSLLLINQGFLLAENHVKHYTLIECTVPAVGLLSGMVLVTKCGLGAEGVLLGLLTGTAFGNLAGLRQAAARVETLRVDPVMTWKMLRFGLPLTLSYALEYILAASDRFLLQEFVGAAELGIYALAYSLGERFVTSLFLVFATGSYTTVLVALEQQGREAAQRQAGRNASLVLMVAVPACGGLIAVSPQMASIVVGPEYSAQAAIILPWIAAAAFLNGLKQHYYDHAFHFANKTNLNIAPVAVAALLNVGLNILLLPRIGWIGAVYATLASYAVALMMSIGLGRLVFSLPFPFVTMTKAVAATAIMFVSLRSLSLPNTATSLAVLIVAGILQYGCLAAWLDISGLRTKIIPDVWRHAGVWLRDQSFRPGRLCKGKAV